MDKSIQIYIATHKNVEMPNMKPYVPIQVGAAVNEKLPFIGDNVGDNISKKNRNYCELTALYWIWKNTSSDIVGLTHYRRYFYEKIYHNKIDKVISADSAINILKNYDIILPKPLKLKDTIEENYDRYHKIEDLYMCEHIIEEMYPDYKKDFDEVLKQRKMYAFNMFIMKKQDFDEYMTWLFNILTKLEEKIDINTYDKYNQRIYGFLSERLFNVWIKKNNYKIKQLHVYNIEQKIYKEYIRNYIIGR